MHQFNPQSNISPKVLATDLDGTFIPLKGEADNTRSLEAIKKNIRQSDIRLVYATGRHLESVLHAVKDFQLPLPDWLICDVGTSIYSVKDEDFELFIPYKEHLESLSCGCSREEVQALLIDVANLKLQTEDRQQAFKISYECEAEQTDSLLDEINQRLHKSQLPYICTGSVDPFEKCGLLDVLPVGVSKAYALIWLSRHADFLPDEVVFAGDSGNDRAALISGFRAIVVGNASAGLAEDVQKIMSARRLERYCYLAKESATSGVLEGCRHYGLMA